MATKQTGGGRFDPNDRYRYFVATSPDQMQTIGVSDWGLVAVNELKGAATVAKLRALCDRGDKYIFLDSGIFFLATTHAEKHGLTMDQALSMPPDEVDGFQELYDRYVKIATELGDKLWGYIELDQGGRENKIKTRAKLEALGLRPIPVYHPFNDGWDYFDELASQYDRICFGNVVQANAPTRKRLVATAWERRRKYPNLWIHLLGYTTNETLNAMPVDSCDSSTWLSAVRWPAGWRTFAAGKAVGGLPIGMTYDLDAPSDSPSGSIKSKQAAVYQATLRTDNWRAYVKAWGDVGFDVTGGWGNGTAI